MKTAIIIFPGTNRENDLARALAMASGGTAPAMIWHGEAALPPGLDLIALPGGFSWGDYLRCGAMAAHSPVIRAVVERARAGTPVLGICNGFQILCETGLLPGVLMPNAGLKFICKHVHLRSENTGHPMMAGLKPGDVIRVPVAHHDGNYTCNDETLARLEGEGRVAFRYAHPDGTVDEAANPNGSRANIAGIFNEAGTVLGMMPHPENALGLPHASHDGALFFDGLKALVA